MGLDPVIDTATGHFLGLCGVRQVFDQEKTQVGLRIPHTMHISSGLALGVILCSPFLRLCDNFKSPKIKSKYIIHKFLDRFV